MKDINNVEYGLEKIFISFILIIYPINVSKIYNNLGYINRINN